MTSSHSSTPKRIALTLTFLLAVGVSGAWAQSQVPVRKTSLPAAYPTNTTLAVPSTGMGFTSEDERAMHQVFMNNSCAASFIPQDVAENTLKILLDDAIAVKLVVELNQRGFAWSGNSRNQNYVAIYPVFAAILRGAALSQGNPSTNLRDLMAPVNLTEVNASILENSAKFRETVEAIGNAGFRFQVDAMQESAKMGHFGIVMEKENPQEALASQLGYLTRNAQGTYVDSAFVAAYLSELTKMALKR